VLRELRSLVSCKTYNDVIEPNPENPEFRQAFQRVWALSSKLGLRVQNHAYETMEIRLEPKGAAAKAAPVVIFAHVEVMRPVEYKWDTDTPPFALSLKGDRWVGLGVYGDKGPLLVNLFALRVMRDANLRLVRPVVLLVGSTTSTPGSGIATSLAKLATPPALTLAADGYFPFATGPMGNLLARVSSAQGMKSLAGLQPGMFYIYKLSGPYSLNAVPAETRAWVLYKEPVGSLNPSLDMVNKWRGIIEPLQQTIPVTRFGTYVQEDTLHFFSYTVPSHAESREGRNSIMDLMHALHPVPMLHNSAWEIVEFVEKGLQMDPTGKAAGLAFEHPTMGTPRINPVQFDRVGDEVAVLVDIRWPLGHDRAWIRERMQELVQRLNKEVGAHLKLDWEGEGREPVELQPPAATADRLREAYELSSGDPTAEPAPASQSSGTLMPQAIPFGPERPGVDKHGFTLHESISERELSDLGVAYAAALAWFGTAAAVP
jgi:succinyl-diaminopimelate desuccinylase